MPTRQARTGIWLYRLVPAIVALALALSACGFHLRGSDSARWPKSLDRLQLQLDPGAGELFQQTLRGQLVERYRVRLVQESAPVLRVTGISQERRVLSLSVTGKASEYLLRFRVQFRLLHADGSEAVPLQTIRLQRDFSYDAGNILAKEAEEQRIYDEMQRDAARRVLQAVATILRERES